MIKNYYKLIVALLFATNVFGQNLPSYLPKDGLVGWWPFNGNANDESGNGNHGIVNGTTLTSDRLGNSNSAYSFDGISNYIVVKNITTNLESFTLSGWFASNSFKGSAFFQVGEDSGHGDCGGLAIGQGNGDFGSNGNQLIGINSCKNWIGTNVIIPEVQKWNHIVIVKDSLNLKYFFNGKLIYSNQIFEPNKMPSTIFFGTRFFDANCAFDGILDDISYYSRSLNEAEIQALYTTTPISENLPSYLPKDGLVGWWPFNGNANDESGNGNHGNINGAALTLDRNGHENKAYNFDGISSFIEVKHSKSLIFEKNFSIYTWVKINDYSKNENQYWKRRTIVGKPRSQQGTGIELFSVNGESSTFGGGIRNSYPDGAGVTSLDSLTLNKWELLILTYNGEKIKLYKNGNLIGETLTNLGLDPSTSSLFFGKEFYGEVSESRSFKGQIDDIAIFNRALTEKEIQALYTGTPITQNLPSYLPKDGLVGWWPFNGNANDESGNGNHGTVYGATLTSNKSGNEGNAYFFDGQDDYIEVLNNSTLNPNVYTLSAWINPKQFSSNQQDEANYIIGKGNDFNSGHYSLHYKSSSLKARASIGEGSNGLFVNSTSNINLNSWIYLTSTWDGKNLKIYFNGKLENTVINGNKTFNSNNENLFFGTMAANSTWPYWLNGKIDDIAIYNRALTEAEIQALYTGTPLCSTPPTPKVNPTVTTCAGNSISFEATGATGVETFNWYDAAEGGTPIATSQIFKTPVLNYGENKTYWVSITNGVCESTRARVDVVVKELPTLKNPENISVCSGEFIQTINFAVSPQGATNYWSNDNTAIGLPTNGVGEIPGFKTPSNINSPILSNITVTPSFNGCVGKSETFKIYVISTPKVAITNLKPIVYTSDATIALEGEPAGGTFTGEAIVGNIFTPAKTTLGKKSIEYKYVSKDGCGGIATASTIVVDTNGVVCTKYDTITVKETIYDTVLKITFKLTTGINISKTTSLTVYPNPTADNLIIDAADVTEMNGYRYQLMDALGKEIYSQLVTSKKTEISLKTLGAKGVYVLHVLDANNQSIVSKKIVLE